MRKNILCSENVGKDPRDNEGEGSKEERKKYGKEITQATNHFKANESRSSQTLRIVDRINGTLFNIKTFTDSAMLAQRSHAIWIRAIKLKVT